MRGVREDVARRLPHLGTDVLDGLNVKCLASTCFMFFGCIAPAIAFGGVLEVATRGAMGVVEMVFSTAVMGVLYSAFSGQPVTIIGSTGPMLAFTATLCHLCAELGLPFLPTYAWVGAWSAAMLLACAATSASNLVKYLTGFTGAARARRPPDGNGRRAGGTLPARARADGPPLRAHAQTRSSPRSSRSSS